MRNNKYQYSTLQIHKRRDGRYELSERNYCTFTEPEYIPLAFLSEFEASILLASTLIKNTNDLTFYEDENIKDQVQNFISLRETEGGEYYIVLYIPMYMLRSKKQSRKEARMYVIPYSDILLQKYEKDEDECQKFLKDTGILDLRYSNMKGKYFDPECIDLHSLEINIKELYQVHYAGV